MPFRDMPTALELAKARTTILEVAGMRFPEWKPKSRNPHHCPYREDKKPSLSIYDGRRFLDHSSGERGGVVEFLALVDGLSKGDACRALIQIDRARHGEGGCVSPSAPSPPTIQRPRQKPRMPIFDEGSPAEHHALAKLRNLCPEAIALAVKRGILRFFNSREGRAWVVTDPDRWAAQARRLDGVVWQRISGQPKAWTLPGSRASWPVGFKDAIRRKRLALCEGGPDAIAAFHFASLSNCARNVGVVCILGAGCSIPKECLSFFASLPIRIFVHADRAGLGAAKGWAKQLAGAGARVTGFSFDGLARSDGQPVEDLNDLASVGVESWEQHREVIESAMFF